MQYHKHITYLVPTSLNILRLQQNRFHSSGYYPCFWYVIISIHNIIRCLCDNALLINGFNMSVAVRKIIITQESIQITLLSEHPGVK